MFSRVSDAGGSNKIGAVLEWCTDLDWAAAEKKREGVTRVRWWEMFRRRGEDGGLRTSM